MTITVDYAKPHIPTPLERDLPKSTLAYATRSTILTRQTEIRISSPTHADEIKAQLAATLLLDKLGPMVFGADDGNGNTVDMRTVKVTGFTIKAGALEDAR